MDDRVLRKALVDLLAGEHAHASVEHALKGLPAADRHRRAPGFPHSAWELLEHVRLAQEDILRYTLDPAWRSPEWPGGYWPAPERAPGPPQWKRSLDAFRADL